MDTVDYGYGDDEDGHVELEWGKLRFTNGQELTEDEQEIVRRRWDTAYEKAFEDKLQAEYESERYMERESEARDDASREAWGGLSDSEKLQIYNDSVAGHGRNYRRQLSAREPNQWVTGVETGTHTEDNYARTHAIALKLAELRTDELLKARGLAGPKEKPEYEIRKVTFTNPDKTEYHVYDKATGKNITGTDSEEGAKEDAEEWARLEQSRGKVKTPQMIGNIWDEWKRSSSEGLSMAVQLAAARELGGHHRMTPEEVTEAEQEARPYGGIPVIQAYVRAQWETTQFVMDRAHAGKVDVFRGLMLPEALVNTTKKVYIDEAGNEVKVSGIETGINSPTGKPYVRFKLGGEQYVIEKERRPATRPEEKEPVTWHEVDPDTKAKVYEQWQADAAKTTDGKLTEEKVKKLYDHLGDDGRFQLMHDYAAQGKITLPKFEPRPYETDEEAIERRLNAANVTGQYGSTMLAKLPDLRLQRAGAQSTTGTSSVANSWGGVGVSMEHPTRVVLRISAPPTSVFSLPVYGQNSQEEHETVVLGTTDKWLWDAWQHRAPEFTTHSITGEPVEKKPLGTVEWPEAVDYDTQQALKAEKPPLVIDLQAEDRGKPHWMTGVDWAKVDQTEK